MADEEKQKRGTPWLASWLFILLVVYPLSIGPANWLCNHLETPQWVGERLQTLSMRLEAAAISIFWRIPSHATL